MVDLHCHLLPNVDDGAGSLEESLWMARFYVAEGTRYVVATPHCYRDRPLLRAAILPAVSALVAELAAAEIPLSVLPGSEIQIVDSTRFRREFEEGLYCHLGGGRRFTLVEFSWQHERLPADATKVIEWIVEQGTTPILRIPSVIRTIARTRSCCERSWGRARGCKSRWIRCWGIMVRNRRRWGRPICASFVTWSWRATRTTDSGARG